MSNHKQDGSISNQTWGGRFSVAPAETLAAYTESQSFDRRLYAQDIRASQAHARMLARQGIISAKEADILVDGLSRILGEIESGSFVWKSNLEDVHMNIEARLVDIAGETGKKLHTGRSRNDQVGLTFRLYVAEHCEAWIDACVALCTAICEKARESQDIILPGFTHLQPAQPVSLAHHLLAYAAMLRRDTERLADSLKRTKISPLGAAALAGSTYPLDPTGVAAEVGFPNIYSNSMDAVSDRDFVLESLFCASVIMAHLSRFCEEIIIWASPAFGFIYLPDAYSTGSSIMPQKKNPDVAELMRGKCGRVYGHLMAMLTIIKGLPLSYNRDLQEDKEGFFDTDSTVMMSLGIMADMLSALRFNKQGMLDACKKGFLNATELADYLATKGMPFREAHHIAGKAVALAEGEGKGLEDLPMDALKTLSPLIDEDIYDVLDYQACVRRRETPGGTGPKSVSQQILNLECWLKEMKNGATSK